MSLKKLVSIVLILFMLVMVSAFSFDINKGDCVSIFNDVLIAEDEIFTGDAVAIFGKMAIRGNVRGDVVAIFGNIDIYGEIGGDVVTIFGNINIDKNAVVSGDIVELMGKVNRDSGAVIRGDTIDSKVGALPRSFNIMPFSGSDIGTVISMIVTYIFACLVLLLVPDRVSFMVQSYNYNIGRSLGIGILVMLGMMLLIPVMMITIIGIIPAILLIIAFAIAVLVSMTAFYIALGRKVAAAVEGKNAVYIHLLIGLVIVSALQIVPILGFLVGLTVFFIALGIAFDTRIGKSLERKTQV
ncbi:MAG: hypothetical protein WBL93_05805 [Lutisporaceae bacterium]